MPFTAFGRYLALSGDGAFLEEGPWGEEQRGDYESGLVRLKGETWRLRTGKVTPKRPGVFVAVWERDEHGEAQPFKVDAAVAGLMVFVEDQDRFGVFRITTAEQVKLGLIRTQSQRGKQGFRLYPDWCVGLNPQALRMQKAQASSFIEMK